MRAKGIGMLAVVLAGGLLIVTGGSASTAPTAVTLVGDLQSEVGCPGDWDPGCGASHMTAPAKDGIYRFTANLPAGTFQYKAAIDDSWNENYGAHAAPGGDNVSLTLPSPRAVHFYYDPVSHWITDDVTSRIVTAPGSYQSELGCTGDWDHVEKGAACDEIGNRTLILTYGSTGTQAVGDTVANWRNVAPCGS